MFIRPLTPLLGHNVICFNDQSLEVDVMLTLKDTDKDETQHKQIYRQDLGLKSGTRPESAVSPALTLTCVYRPGAGFNFFIKNVTW